MAAVREGKQTVLLVVDVQLGAMAGAWDAARVVAKLARTVERARLRGVPMLWVQQAGEELPHGSAAWQWVPELVPAPGEPLVAKRFNPGFEDTVLEAGLARLGATPLMLAGAATHRCMRGTAYAALERGYALTLLGNAHGTETLALDGGVTIAAADVIQNPNTAMTWLRCPGRRKRTATAEDVAFAAAA